MDLTHMTDARVAMAAADVPDDMRKAGAYALTEWYDVLDPESVAAEVYSAMHLVWLSHGQVRRVTSEANPENEASE